MTVTTNISLGAGIPRTNYDQSSKLSAVLNSTSAAPSASAITAQPGATQISQTVPTQTAETELRAQTLSIAEQFSKAEVLDVGASEVLRILGLLQGLASRASQPGLSDGQRAALNSQYRALSATINGVPPTPPGSQYKAAGLAGASAKDLTEADAAATLGGFSTEKLLGSDAEVNVLTEAAAEKALTTLAQASQTIAAQKNTLERLLGVIDFAAATAGSALQNLEASNATLGDEEETTGFGALAELLRQQPEKAIAAQTARLPNNILQLLG